MPTVALPRALAAPHLGATQALREVASREQPPAPAEHRLLPVLPPLQPLLPGAGLRRGSVVTVTGSTSLALALIAGASAAGSWCAAVGLPSLGLLAASEVGIALDRFPVVAWPSSRWAWVVASLLDGFDAVVACPPRRPVGAGWRSAVSGSDARRLAARGRERGSVLVVTGEWPEPTDVRLDIESARWHGLGQAHGSLRGRQVEVVSTGRGAASRRRRAKLWLPDHRGAVASV